MVRIALCGGGSLSHALAAVFGGRADVEVRVLTRQPTRWSREVRGIYLDVAEVRGRVALASSDPSEAVAGADIVILCLPSCAREGVLEAIAPFLAAEAWVGSFPGYGGFEWEARDILGPKAVVFGLQRVPYVRKTISYGEAVWISGIRPRLVLGALPASRAPEIARTLEELISIPTDPVPHYLPVTLSASNPVFHPARIYSAFRDFPQRSEFPQRRLFYEDWEDDASAVFLALDDELQMICARIPADMSAAQPIRAHYGAADAAALTRRIRSLRSLRDRYLPLVSTDRGYVPDVHSSYFTEDVPYGLLVIKSVAQIVCVPTPHIDAVLRWAERAMGRQYLLGDRVEGKDATGLPLPARFGIASVEELVSRAR